MAHNVAAQDRRGQSLSELPEQAFRGLLLALSRRRSLGRLATGTSVTRPMVRRFVAGQTLDEALDVVADLNARGFNTTLDVLGESVASEAAARAAGRRYHDALDGLVARGLERNVSLKLTQMGLDVSEAVCLDVVGGIAAKAHELGAFVRIDMEDHSKTDATLGVLRRIRAAHPDTGIVIQAALRRSAQDVETLIGEGCSVRLCKGAYREPASVAYPDKADVDAAYIRLAQRLVTDGTGTGLATHDPRMIQAVVDVARREGIAPDRFEFQMLFGVRRDLQEQLLADGWRVRVYVPFGADWYPYFMRRLAERPANVAFMLKALVRERGGSGTTPRAGTAGKA